MWQKKGQGASDGATRGLNLIFVHASYHNRPYRHRIEGFVKPYEITLMETPLNALVSARRPLHAIIMTHGPPFRLSGTPRVGHLFLRGFGLGKGQEEKREEKRKEKQRASIAETWEDTRDMRERQTTKQRVKARIENRTC